MAPGLPAGLLLAILVACAGGAGTRAGAAQAPSLSLPGEEALAASGSASSPCDPASIGTAADHRYLADALRAHGRLDEALAHYDRALALFPDYALAHDGRGVTLVLLGRDAEAKTEFDAAIALDPALAEAYSDRGLLRYYRHDYVGALADLESALRLAPDLGAAHFNSGLVLRDLGRTAMAKRAFEAAVRYQAGGGRDADTLYHRGLANDFAGHLRAAIADYTAAIKGGYRRLDMAYFDRGSAWSYLGRYERAVTDFTRALGENPMLAWAYNNRANALWILGRMGAAGRDYDMALLLDPSDPKPWLNRAFLHFLRGEYRAAERNIRASLAVAPAGRDAVYALLALRLARGKTAADDPDDLARRAAPLDLGPWPGPLLAHYLGRLDADAVASVASGDGTPAQQRMRRCDISFYLGEKALIEGDRDAARRQLHFSAASCRPAVESYVAQAELARLGPAAAKN